MSKVYWSPATKGFYEERYHGVKGSLESKIPDDAVEVSHDLRDYLLQEESNSKGVIGLKGTTVPKILDPLPEKIEHLASRKRTELDQARDEAFAAGLEYDFNGETDVVQTRPQDQVNLLGLRAKAEAAIDQGATDLVMKFRGENNVTRYLTPDEMYTLTNDALTHIEGIYDHSWERKDAIDAALEEEDRKKIEAIKW